MLLSLRMAFPEQSAPQLPALGASGLLSPHSQGTRLSEAGEYPSTGDRVRGWQSRDPAEVSTSGLAGAVGRGEAGVHTRGGAGLQLSSASARL